MSKKNNAFENFVDDSINKSIKFVVIGIWKTAKFTIVKTSKLAYFTCRGLIKEIANIKNNLKYTNYRIVSIVAISAIATIITYNTHIKYAPIALLAYLVSRVWIKLSIGSIKKKKELFRIMKLQKKYKGFSELFNDQVKILDYKDNVYSLHSFISLSEVIKKHDMIEHFFNRSIESITRNSKNFKLIYINMKDTNKSNKLKKVYKLSNYINVAPVNKKYTLPFILGINKNGETVVKDLTEIKSVLIAGLPGGGKSVLTNCIIQSLMYYNSNITYLLVDFKEVELCKYEKFDNVNFVDNLDSFKTTLELLKKEMDKRYKLMRKKEVTNITELNNKTFICLVIDEISEIKLNAENKKETEMLENTLTLIMNKGRACGIYIIIATQRPNAEQLNSNVKANINLIISFKIGNVVTQNIVGIKGTENLKVGEFKTINDKEEIETYKSFYTGKKKEIYDMGVYDELKENKTRFGGISLVK